MRVRYNKDLLGATIFLVISVAIWLLIPYQIVIKTDDLINSQSFPRLVVGLMGLCSLYLLLKEIIKIALKKEQNMGEIILKEEVKRLLMIGLVVLFWVLLHWVPFVVSAMIFGSLTLILFGSRKWSYYGIVNGLIVGVTLVFQYALHVNLP
ncbi:tripartite tricarboxylate transporter TctB family protein [Vallitalea okinawensis]|uniref:tripartite tricarboxylate transporter TctB family protein n=1 Tax=Vallitalea okinawensis TaxID=2078660 RepID=UPI000CFC6214|nr:tripartite tricarboxylate transporter TctB family protein [Vallitalea okinawensis]